MSLLFYDFLFNLWLEVGNATQVSYQWWFNPSSLSSHLFCSTSWWLWCSQFTAETSWSPSSLPSSLFPSQHIMKYSGGCWSTQSPLGQKDRPFRRNNIVEREEIHLLKRWCIMSFADRQISTLGDEKALPLKIKNYSSYHFFYHFLCEDCESRLPEASL